MITCYNYSIPIVAKPESIRLDKAALNNKLVQEENKQELIENVVTITIVALAVLLAMALPIGGVVGFVAIAIALESITGIAINILAFVGAELLLVSGFLLGFGVAVMMEDLREYLRSYDFSKLLAGSQPVYSSIRSHLGLNFACNGHIVEQSISHPEDWQYLSEFDKQYRKEQAVIIDEFAAKNNDTRIVDIVMGYL